MAKVDFPDTNFIFNPASYANIQAEAGKTKERAAVRENRKPKFSKILENAEAAGTEEPENIPASEEALQGLLDEVHSSGDDLKRRPFPEEIKRYKQAVRNFIHYVVENGYTVEDQTGIPNFLRPGYKGQRGTEEAKARKKHTLVKVVDQKLERLAAGIMAGQLNQLQLLTRIDEIAGLLVNLLQ
ncbi:MAG: DUF327 family protein [Treponema sp.]|jgi:uncharacterized protein YaaR (DUF327 family)|nr:DUF327 family protein [Treponema sp.]